MSTNFNDLIPAPPANNTNVKFQTDGSGNDSAYVPTPFLVETDVIITSLIPGDILVWNGSNWVNAFPVFPANTPAVAGQALTGYDDTTGLFTQSAVGAGVWASYSPIITSVSGTFTTASATGEFLQVGKIVYFTIEATITTVGSGNYPLITLPVTAAATTGFACAAREQASTGNAWNGNIVTGGGTTTQIALTGYNNGIASSGYVIVASGFYAAA